MHTKVGQRTLRFCDPQCRNWAGTAPRPLRSEVWYPAPPTAEARDVYLGPPEQPLFYAGTTVRDAELLSTPQRFPLILLSHGTGGSACQLAWLGTYLAAHGFLVVGVNHHGNTSLEPYTAQGFCLWWERALDLTRVLDQLLRDPLWGPRIDPMRIAAAGFSLGGYTVIALAGGITHLAAYTAFCQSAERDATCEDQPEFPGMIAAFARLKHVDPQVQASLLRHHVSYRDARIQAVFAIAPVLGGAFTPTGLRQVSIPVQIVVGAADKIAPPPTNAQRFARLIPGATLTILPGHVGHYTFLCEATAYGKAVHPAICVDHVTVDRAAVHQQVREMVVTFFAQHVASHA